MSRSLIRINTGSHKRNRWATKSGRRLRELANQAENMFDDGAHAVGFEVHHRGWPDRLIYFKGHTYFVEIKLRKAKLTQYQKNLHKALKRLGIEVVVFRINPKVENEDLRIRNELYSLFPDNAAR